MVDTVGMIISAIAKFFVYALLARSWMIAFRMPFRHPLGQFVRTATGWLTKPFEGRSLNHLRFILIPVIQAWIILCCLGILLMLLSGIRAWAPFFIIVVEFATIQLLLSFLYMLIGAMVVQAILSWVNPYAPVMGFLLSFTAPFLSIFRRFIPVVSGIDFSPMAAIFVCYLLISLLNQLSGFSAIFF